jgi:hypothetical protein
MRLPLSAKVVKLSQFCRARRGTGCRMNLFNPAKAELAMPLKSGKANADRR